MKKKILLIIICCILGLTSIPREAKAAVGVNIAVETISASFGTENSFIPFSGVTCFVEHLPELRSYYSILMADINNLATYFSISIAYVVNIDYSEHLRPYFMIGIDPFLTDIKPQESLIGISYHVGMGVDYVFDNTWYINFNTKVFLHNPWEDPINQQLDEKARTHFDPGTFSLNLGFGYQF